MDGGAGKTGYMEVQSRGCIERSEAGEREDVEGEGEGVERG